MENRHPLKAARVSAAAALITVLAFAGFGCRPILDARLKQVQQQQDQPSMWLPDGPQVAFKHDPDLMGQITIDVRSQPNTTIAILLNGPGLGSDAYQVMDVGKDNIAHFKWKTDRLGHYTYSGTITFNRNIVETFSDEFDNDVGQ